MTPVQTLSSGATAAKNTAGEILVSSGGKFLYVSNRGTENNVAVFSADPSSGKLTFVQSVPTHGQTPRNFAIDPTGQWLIVGNQDSKSVYMFKFDRESGRLKQVGPPLTIDSPAMVD